jgi:acyl-CoA reductase-like NAD-dependent aldehyde dehydrogenase
MRFLIKVTSYLEIAKEENATLIAPFCRFKKSGVGREGEHHSMEFFKEAKNICIALK